MPSFLTKLMHVMIWNMILKRKTRQMIKIKMNLPHTQSFNLLSILLDLRNPPKFLFSINSGQSSLKLLSQWLLTTRKRSMWLVTNHIIMVVNLRLTLLWVNLIQIHNDFIYMRRMISQKIRSLRLLHKLWHMNI